MTITIETLQRELQQLRDERDALLLKDRRTKATRVHRERYRAVVMQLNYIAQRLRELRMSQALKTRRFDIHLAVCYRSYIMKNTTTATTVRFNYYTLNALGKTCPKCGSNKQISYDWDLKTGAAKARHDVPSCNHTYDPTTRKPIVW